MILVDYEIKDLIEKKQLIHNADLGNIGAIAYDLRMEEAIYQNDEGGNVKSAEFSLKPQASVIISTIETIEMPNDLVGKVIDRNSQIRRGLQIAAPVYQPGHKTRVFIRVTNLSNEVLELRHGDGIASIMFMKLDNEPRNPYKGEFKDEYEYKGLGAYKDVFVSRIAEVDAKIEDAKRLESRIYGNVITLMSIFIGLFSLININLDMVLKLDFTKQSIFAFDLMILGVIGMFVAFISNVVPMKRNMSNTVLCYGLPICLLVATACII